MLKEKGHNTYTWHFPIPKNNLVNEFTIQAACCNSKTHGEALISVASTGPLFPAECTVSIPLSIAWKAPIAIASRVKSTEAFSPMETVMISTPSAHQRRPVYQLLAPFRITNLCSKSSRRNHLSCTPLGQYGITYAASQGLTLSFPPNRPIWH